jgi:prolyl oligopeptidase
MNRLCAVRRFALFFFAMSCAPTLRARIDPVNEVLHGVAIPDPYRWLERGDAEEVRSWVAAQNAHTTEVLGGVPGRAKIRRQVKDLLSIGQVSAPAVRYRGRATGRYFYTRRTGLQNQAVLLFRDGLRGEDRVLVDPNTLAKDGTATLDWYFPSVDGKLVAYGISKSGDEDSTLRIRDVDTGADLPDVIDRTRHCSIDWQPDGKAFYYTRYPAPGSVPKDEERYHRHVFLHRLGADPATDAKVFGEGRDAKDWPNVTLSPNGRWLVVSVSQGWQKTEVYLKDLSRPDGSFVPLVEKIDAIFDVTVLDDRIFVHTNHKAPRYRLYAVDPTDLRRETPLIDEGEHVLQSAGIIGRKIFALYLRDASSWLRVFDFEGRSQGDIALPTLGSISGVSGEWDGPEAFFGFTSFAVPSSIYRYDLASKGIALWESIQAPIRPEDFEVRQVRFPSKDGTQISMFLVHKKGLAKNGNLPVYLTGYGGFNISLTPAFLGASYLFLERGGVIAEPNLRGGGEYGESWHKAGTLGQKQNVFDDFIAAAEWLIREGYTRPERLAIGGGSNGGLLVGAALTQRPDLFRAVYCSVPLLDMIRYHRFLIAKLWVPEYGSADDREQFQWLWRYSPYHRVRDGTKYPAVLISTAESDSRVDPMHARKMAARLQAATSAGPERPILLRIETKAGHGAGKPIAKVIEQSTDVWAFLFSQLGL